jgi:GNAT superfamily N-acetyltransferase
MLELRPATPADALAVATVHVRAWQAGYRSLISQTYLDSLRPEDRASHYTLGASDPSLPSTVVAELDGTICGFASVAPCLDEGSDTGELHALHVDPLAWGIGAGRMLIADARARMHASGFSEAVLWVLAGNARAERFYRTDGWLPESIERTAEIWDIEIRESRFRRRLP